MYLRSTGNLPQDVLWLLNQTADLTKRSVDRKSRFHGLSEPSFEVLYTLAGSQGRVTAYGLSKILGNQHHSTVELVNRLRKKGLVVRKETEEGHTLILTETGIKALSNVLGQQVFSIPESLDQTQLSKLKEGLLELRSAALKDLGELDHGEIPLTPPD